MPRVNFYYAANSTAELGRVCKQLERVFDLPSFTFDTHDHWEYGVSEGPRLGMNVTKTDDDRTIETWIPGCPTPTNYQIILTADAEPLNFLQQMVAILGTDVTRYAQVPAVKY